MSKYKANITPLNQEQSGTEPMGTAIFTLDEKRLTISIEMKNVPANVMHRQDFHGLVDDRMAEPATKDQDTNHDGVVDSDEIQAVSGQAMVPFNEAPQRLDFSATSYPVANDHGNYDYYKEVGIDELVRNFKNTYNNAKLDLDKRVIYIYGVANDTTLPAGIAAASLPIACGKIEAVE